MFRMEVESQLNMKDRTLIGGKPAFTDIPGYIIVSGKKYRIIGVSKGIKLPYMSLEVEKTSDQLQGKLAIA